MRWTSCISRGRGRFDVSITRLTTDAAPPVLLLLLAVLLYYPSSGSFWLYDDPALLKQAVLHHPWEYFFVPDVWRLSSAGNFTPWVLLSFDLDVWLFGLRPFGFYMHQIVSICLLALVAYAVLRKWFSREACFMGVSLFLLSPPFAESADLLMERHYIEGLLLSLVSVYLYRKSEDDDSDLYAAAGALFYLAASLSKEIYVPLLFLLPFLSRGPWKKRARHAMPWVLVVVLYTVWRRFMLGRFTGGYGVEFVWPLDLWLLPGRLIKAMGGDGGSTTWWAWLIGAGFFMSLGFILKTDRRKFPAVMVGSMLLIAPIIPVSPIMSPRYVWLVFFGWFLLNMTAWEAVKRSGGRLSSCGTVLWYLVLASFFLYMTVQTPRLDAAMKQQTSEGRFVLYQGGSTDMILNAASSGWYYSELSWLRENVLRLPRGPAVLGDQGILCFARMAPERTGGRLEDRFRSVWQYDPARGEMGRKDIDVYVAGACGEETRNIRADAPLSLKVVYGNSEVSWILGPYPEGTYALLLGETSESLFPLPRTGKRSVSFKGQTVYFRARYISPEGWTTYSPALKMQVDGDRGGLSWERRSNEPASR